MEHKHIFKKIPPTRIATFDIFSIGLRKHHVIALLEFDVTDARSKLKELRRKGMNVTFNAWLIKTISDSLDRHKEAAAFLYSKKKLIVFDDINVSVIVEKKIEATKIPIPLVIEKANKKSAAEISYEIDEAKKLKLSDKNIVLGKESNFAERLYYHMPGFLRSLVWKIILGNPERAFRKMGNVSITSVGMMGEINGWFIHKSIHPVSFGIGSVIKKPVVVGKDILIREILNMTILADHDVIDGAPMVRFLNDLTKDIERGV